MEINEPEGDAISNFSADVPIESYFCGLSYEEASESCSVPCADGKCPNGEKCFAFTPCAKPESFFCGTDMNHANENCAIPCPTGTSKSCPIGQSCFAYTTCDVDLTSVDIEEPEGDAISSFELSPSTSPITMSPTRSPTLEPITDAPSTRPTESPTDEPTVTPTDERTVSLDHIQICLFIGILLFAHDMYPLAFFRLPQIQKSQPWDQQMSQP